MQLTVWLRSALVLLALSFSLFALPSHLEGPVLLSISPGHAIAVLDAVAIVPLLVASALLVGGAFSARVRLQEFIRQYPSTSLHAGFAGGLGLGLLLASAFADFSGWWAVGAALFAGFMIAVGLLAGRR